MKRLIFINRFFYPDQSATSQLLSDLAFYLAVAGFEVHVVTSLSRYDNSKSELPAREVVQGVNVHRLRTTRCGRSQLFGRAIDYISFYFLMCWRLLGLVQSGDIIIAKTDPPLLSVPVNWIARIRRAQVVHWLHDIYPEIAVKLGVPFFRGPVGWSLALMRDRSLRRSDAIVVLGERMAATLCDRGISKGRIHIVPNWTDDEQITPMSALANPLRHKWSLQDKFVVGYSGNLGRAHEFHTVLAAAERLRNNSRIVFVFIGGGFRLDALSRAVRERGLEAQFRFLPYQERDQLRYSLSVPDIHWISLNPEVEGLIFPSKLYGIAAAGRPMIAVTAKDSEIAYLVQRHACGFAVEPQNSEALSEAILMLSSDQERCEAMGRNARAMLDAHFSRRLAFQRWGRLLERFAKSP